MIWLETFRGELLCLDTGMRIRLEPSGDASKLLSELGGAVTLLYEGPETVCYRVLDELKSTLRLEGTMLSVAALEKNVRRAS